jgi:hypothetical protein
VKRSLLALTLLLPATAVHAQPATPIKLLPTSIQAAQPPESAIMETIRSHIDVAKYREVRVQLIRDAAGNPSHYLAYLLSKKYHRVDVARLTLDQQFKVLNVQQNYRLQEADFAQQPSHDLSHAACPDASVQFIAFAPNDVQVEQDVTNDVASAAIAAKLKTVKLLKSLATRASYLNYLTCPNIEGNFYDGDSNPQLFITVDSVISADDVKTILKKKFHYLTTNIWLACEAYNDPMLSAVVNDAQAKKFAAGINDLAIGPSDKAGACAMKAAIAGKPMQSSFNACYKQYDVSSDHWGFGGDGTDYFKSPGYYCAANFPKPDIKYDHTDPAGRVYTPVQNWSSYAAELFNQSPETPACGLNKSSSRTWIDIYNAANNTRIYGFCAIGSNTDLQGIWFKPGTAHGKSYIIMQDRDCGNKYKSNTVAW